MDVLATIIHAIHGSAETKRQCYEQLIGAEQGWLHACRQSMRQGHTDWLRLQEPDPLWWAWQLIGELCEREEFRYPEIASAIAACAQAAVMIRSLEHAPATPHCSATLVEHVLQATYQWQRSHSPEQAAVRWSDEQIAPHLEAFAHDQMSPKQQVQSLLTCIRQYQPACNPAPVRDLIDFFLHGMLPPPVSALRIPVLLDVGTYGLVADIHLDAVSNGLGVWYADPCTMAFFRGDSAFFAALETAHTYARAESGGDPCTDIRWRLTVRPTVRHPTSAIAHVAGASLSAGFAVGMLHLLDPHRPDLDPSWAITGNITPTGDLLPVQGYPAKIETALEHNLRVIVPEVNLDTLRNQWHTQPHVLRIRGVSTIAEASEVYSQRALAICPYRGLAVFTEQDAEHFFGRQRLIDTLLAALRNAPRLLAVFGPSGSGKSSLIQAGLLPHLRRGEVPTSEQWGSLFLRPAEHPFAALAACGLKGEHLSQAVLQWLTTHPDSTHLLLVLDQFEEVLVSCPGAIRQQFMTQLVETLAQADIPITIVVVMRDDFYSRLNQQAPDMMPWVSQSLVNIPPTLHHDEIVSIVLEPASAVGWEFEPRLVDVITQDVRDASRFLRMEDQLPRATLLPLLEFALTQLWAHCRDGILTHDAYQSIGRVTGALTHWATATFEQLTPEQQTLARRIFTDLVYLGDESQGLPDSRRRRLFLELYRHASEREAVTEVTQHMTSARLLVTARDSQSGEETVELIHETLVHEWGRLRQWLQRDRLFLVWRQTLESRCSAWVVTEPASQAQRDPDLLLRGRELDEAADWLEQRQASLTDGECTYIRASLDYRIAKQRQEQQRRRRSHIITTTFMVLLVILAMTALWQGHLARQQLAVSKSQRLALTARALLESNPELSLLLVIEAARINQNTEVESMLHQVIQASPLRSIGDEHEGTVNSIAFSWDGSYLVTASTDRTARVWDVQTGTALHILRGHSDLVNDADFSPDGRLIVTASSDKTARIWDAQTGDVVHVLSGHTGSLVQTAFSPDGQWVVTASGLDARSSVSDHSARIWDVQTGQVRHELLHTHSVASATFSPDGRRVVTASSDKTARIWDVQTGNVVRQLDHPHPVSNVQMSRDGSMLVTVADDDVVRIWDAASSEPIQELAHINTVHSMAISPDGRWIVTGDSDGIIHHWDVREGRLTRRMQAHTGVVKDIAFSRDGFILATASDDRTFRLWVHQAAEELHTLRGHDQPIYQATFSPDGQHIVTVSGDTTARVWDVITGEEVRVLNGHTEAVRSAVFSPDGQYIVTASDDATVRVWNAATGATIDVLKGHESPVHRVTYAPDGHMIASVGEDNVGHLWNAHTYEEQVLLEGHTGNILSIAFVPHTRYVVTVGQDYTMRTWNADTGEEVQKLNAHEAIVRDVAVSPDGQMLATGSDDTTVRLWQWMSDVMDSEREEHTEMVTSVTFSPDGNYLLTASADGSVRQWSVHAENPSMQLWHGESRIHDAQYSPDQRYVVVASEDGTAHICYATFADTLNLAQERAIREMTDSERQTYLHTP